MSDRLREDIDNAVEYHSVGGREWLVSDEVVAAARRFLALTETGYRIEWCEVHKVVPHSWHRGRVEEGGEPCRIIAAYVIPADYLTEEET